MRPLRLSMKGFGAFREQTDIDLNDIDLMALVGPTGSGKSTIIDAITFALYGTVARYENNRLVAPVINQTSTEARVSLDFELNEKLYTAVRVVRRRGDGATTKEARLEHGEDILAADSRTLTRKVEELLGLGVEQFNRTVVLPQGKFAAFLHDKPPGVRQATLVRLLGLQLYQRIGQQARQKSAAAFSQVEALQPEHDGRAALLTDAQRARRANRIVTLNDALVRLDRDRKTIDGLNQDIDGLGTVIDALQDKVKRISNIARPANLTTLADQIAAATEAQLQAQAFRDKWSKRRRRSEQALEAGPNLLAVELQLTKHRVLAKMRGDYHRIGLRYHQAADQHETASTEAARLQKFQEEMDMRVEVTRKAAAHARAARDESATIIQIRAWEAAHNRYRKAVEQAETAERNVQSAQQSIPPRRQALESAEAAAQEASARLEALRRHAGVLGHLDLVEVGSECPLCLQQVPDLPVHTFDDADLHRAEESKRRAEASRSEAQGAYEEATARLKGRRAQADAALRSAQQHRSDIDSIPAYEQLDGLRKEATRLAEGVRIAEEAIGQAETAARQHRESPTYTEAMQNLKDGLRQKTRLEAEKDTLSQQLADLANEVAAFPGEDELRAHKREAAGLQRDLREANSRLSAAEERHKESTAQLAELDEKRRLSIADLNIARDRVARYGPPPMDQSDLVTAWTTLTDWAGQQKEAAEAEYRTTIEQKAARVERHAHVLAGLTALCEELLGPIDPGATVGDLSIRLAQDLAVSKAALIQFDQDRDDVGKLKKRIEGLTEQAQVARKLGALLRANGFESWLMEAALDQLVEQATERLYELSNGQYSMEVHRREFYVRDHTNADEMRPARTLSGGETFLASLSLSLALADTTAHLSTGMVSVMESIFLDEGFGTLDRHTLETVATAVEELGAGGKLVGIVTHIRELADRMPVRLEVTKTGGASTVERIDH